MKVCMVGAGAIGGLIGARIAASGTAQVSALARGATLDALREHGWRLRMRGRSIQSPVEATDDPAGLGVQDVVFIAVKGHALPGLADVFAPLIGDDTVVVPTMNGVPWWFVADIDGIGAAPLDSVDPGGGIAAAIPTKAVVGAVVHISAVRHEPGLVEHKAGEHIVVGEPAGAAGERTALVARLLDEAGFDIATSSDIRSEIWYKLWGNMTMNPVSTITGATADRILGDPLVRAFCSDVMREAATIGARIGCPIEEEPEDRHAVTAKLGALKTSMLQDAEAGRAIELDAIVGAVREIGQRLGMATPNIDLLFGLTRLHGRMHGIYPDA